MHVGGRSAGREGEFRNFLATPGIAGVDLEDNVGLRHSGHQGHTARHRDEVSRVRVFVSVGEGCHHAHPTLRFHRILPMVVAFHHQAWRHGVIDFREASRHECNYIGIRCDELRISNFPCLDVVVVIGSEDVQQAMRLGATRRWLAKKHAVSDGVRFLGLIVEAGFQKLSRENHRVLLGIKFKAVDLGETIQCMVHLVLAHGKPARAGLHHQPCKVGGQLPRDLQRYAIYFSQLICKPFHEAIPCRSLLRPGPGACQEAQGGQLQTNPPRRHGFRQANGWFH
mmetsp:Transcript_86920/g.156570  ORF Transcript_86920/g.156570 Transcript_86920/m.156570 type:complete len:282 (-) Transcript_86920:23-868(-)